MNEALAISAANLDVIEKNLGSVATELSGVINNVNSVNSKVNNVEEKVEDINNEIKNLVKEIRENTIITNARQSIMYNNEQIDKKYGYYDSVRRTTESLIDSIINSNINKSSLSTLRQNLLMNNPNYWLSNALVALVSWILDDKVNTEKEVNNSLKKDEIKTSIFFSLVNLKLNRKQASINWLKYYLNRINPTNISSEFVTILDLVSNGEYGIEGKKIIIDKISNWINIISQNKSIYDNEINKWENFINSKQQKFITLPYLGQFAEERDVLKNNLSITSSYKNVLSYINNITSSSEEKNIDKILNNLIYEYEDKEQVYQKDNLKNRLIIECNGDTKKAEEIYNKQEQIYSSKIDLLSLLSNIVIYKNEYKVSSETQKLCLSLIKNNILNAYDNINKKIYNNEIHLVLEDFVTSTQDSKTNEKIEKDLDVYLNSKFIKTDKFLTILLVTINVIGFILIFLALESILSKILGVVIILSNIYIIFKIVDKYKIVTKNKNNKKELLKSTIERTLAEYIDYKKIIENDNKYFEELKVFLNNINIDNYLKTTDGRNIKIGD